MIEYMEELRDANPNLVSIHDFGTTHENRTLKLVKVKLEQLFRIHWLKFHFTYVYHGIPTWVCYYVDIGHKQCGGAIQRRQEAVFLD